LAETIATAAEVLAAQRGRTQVVVQPHLLFHGQLLADIHRQVEAVHRLHPEQAWHVADHLGPALPIRDALLSIVQSSFSSKS
jgi:sirohydrochlorin ferrochelatase